MKTDSLQNNIITAAKETFIKTTSLSNEELNISLFKPSLHHAFDHFMSAFRVDVNDWFDDVYNHFREREAKNMQSNPEFAFAHWLAKSTFPYDFSDDVFIIPLNYNELTDSTAFEFYTDLVCTRADFEKFMAATEGHLDIKLIAQRYIALPSAYAAITKNIESELASEFEALFFSFCASVSVETAKSINEAKQVK